MASQCPGRQITAKCGKFHYHLIEVIWDAKERMSNDMGPFYWVTAFSLVVADFEMEAANQLGGVEL